MSSSDRSLMSALTSLVCSWPRRLRVPGVVAKSSVSVTNSIVAASLPLPSSVCQAKPCASGATAMAKRSSADMNSASDETIGGSMRLSRSNSSRLSRRPSLSATISTRCAVPATCDCRRCNGSGAPRSTLRSGSDRAQPSCAASPRTTSCACRLQAAKNSSGFRNSASGGRIGRSRSCCRKRWRSRVSGPEALQRVVDVAVQGQRGVCAQVIEDRRRALEEERQVVLDAGAGDAGADVLVEPHPRRVAFDALAPARAKGIARGFVHRELAAGQQAHFRHRVKGCAACPDRRCGSSRSRRRTGRRDTALPSPSGTGRSGRRAPRTRRARRPGSRAHSRPA